MKCFSLDSCLLCHSILLVEIYSGLSGLHSLLPQVCLESDSPHYAKSIAYDILIAVQFFYKKKLYLNSITDERVPTELKKSIMQARLDKKLTQAQVAQVFHLLFVLLRS